MEYFNLITYFDRLCTDIVVRAFSQEVFTHKSLGKTEKRSAVKGAIIKWLGEEVDEGVTQVLDQIYEEAKTAINSEKVKEKEVKRKLDSKQALLKKAAKKPKKSN